MMMQKTLYDLLAPVVTAMGYEFVGCELSSGDRSTRLTVYIDKEGGVTADDCGLVSRQVSSVLDVENPIDSRYRLEVSSPGLERPLFTKEHFERFKAHDISIRLKVPLEDRRNFKGTLLSVVDEKLILNVDGKEIEFPLESVLKANLINQD